MENILTRSSTRGPIRSPTRSPPGSTTRVQTRGIISPSKRLTPSGSVTLHRFDHQPLFGKGARRPDTRERWKSSLHSLEIAQQLINFYPPLPL